MAFPRIPQGRPPAFCAGARSSDGTGPRPPLGVWRAAYDHFHWRGPRLRGECEPRWIQIGRCSRT